MIGKILILISGICAIGAVLYQKSDYAPGYGSTMGGEMTAGAIWALVAALAGVGVGILSRWFWGLATLFAVYGGSFAVCTSVESMLSRTAGTDNNTKR